MLAEAAALDLGDSDGAALALPHLMPVQVVAEDGADELVRSARAGVAMLSLQLRAALNEAAVAERGGPQVDLPQATELARSSLEQHLSVRRRDLAEGLERAREEAARTVTAARTEAAGLMATATEETRQILLAGLSSPPAAPPSLRVVDDGPARPVASSHPSVPQLARTERGAQLPEAPVEPEIAAALVEPDPERKPAPRLDLRLDVPVQAALASAAALTAPLEGGGALTETVVVDLDASSPLSAALAPAPSNGAAAGTTVERPERRALSQYLYADVVLPMIAVLVVLVVLLAWVG